MCVCVYRYIPYTKGCLHTYDVSATYASTQRAKNASIRKKKKRNGLYLEQLLQVIKLAVDVTAYLRKKERPQFSENKLFGVRRHIKVEPSPASHGKSDKRNSQL